MPPDSPTTLSRLVWLFLPILISTFMIFPWLNVGSSLALTGSQIEIASIGIDSQQSNGFSHAPELSSDGRYVLFVSAASNLVVSDTNTASDVFLFDRFTRLTERISENASGEGANGDNSRPSMSPDARYVVFSSDATNLVAGYDENLVQDVFWKDRLSGEIERISVSLTGGDPDHESHVYRPAVSADGCLVVFHSASGNLVYGDDNDLADIYLRDRCAESETTQLLSRGLNGEPANGASDYAAISPDGRYVTFTSAASNLVISDTNGYTDVFFLDRISETLEIVSYTRNGGQPDGNSDLSAMSDDGRFIAYYSDATNIVPDDQNDAGDIFLYDRKTGKVTRVSVASDGSEGEYLHDSDTPTISSNGRYVAFYSFADNLVPDDTNGTSDVFIHDTEKSLTTRVSVAFDGTEANDDSYCSAITDDGDRVAFVSLANNLTPGDTNNQYDIFVTAWRAEYTYIFLPLVFQ